MVRSVHPGRESPSRAGTPTPYCDTRRTQHAVAGHILKQSLRSWAHDAAHQAPSSSLGSLPSARLARFAPSPLVARPTPAPRAIRTSPASFPLQPCPRRSPPQARVDPLQGTGRVRFRGYSGEKFTSRLPLRIRAMMGSGSSKNRFSRKRTLFFRKKQDFFANSQKCGKGPFHLDTIPREQATLPWRPMCVLRRATRRRDLVTL